MNHSQRPTRVSRLTQTSERDPSQWEGRTFDGLFVYVRYRWGWLTISSGTTAAQAVMNDNNLFEKQLGDRLDGKLEYERLREVTAGVIEWPQEFEKN
jgi:hypothetical protein